MKKKISLLGLVLILVLSLAGCGSKTKEETVYDQATMEQSANAILGNFTQMTKEQLNSFQNMSEYDLSYLLMSSQIPVDADDFLAMIESWNAGMDECGQFTELGAFEMEVKSEGAVLTAPFTGAERSGELEFTFDEKMRMESMTFNASYSLGEILKKAGLNTLLGMGTVFVVLIFIAFIISLFQYIPAIQKKFSKKNKAENKPAAAPVTAAAPVVTAPAAAKDDSELIAVIAAAIAAAEGTSTDSFIVRSIKRRKSNKWN